MLLGSSMPLLALVLLRVDERDKFFFPGKVLKFVHAQIHFIVFSTFDFLKFSSFTFLKGRQSPPSKSKSVKITKNMVDFNFENEF